MQCKRNDHWRSAPNSKNPLTLSAQLPFNITLKDDKYFSVLVWVLLYCLLLLLLHYHHRDVHNTYTVNTWQHTVNYNITYLFPRWFLKCFPLIWTRPHTHTKYFVLEHENAWQKPVRRFRCYSDTESIQEYVCSVYVEAGLTCIKSNWHNYILLHIAHPVHSILIAQLIVVRIQVS